MPIYEYICSNCNNKLDVLQKINEKPMVKCPKCNLNGLEKIVSTGGFILKGNDWYKPSIGD